MKRNRKFYVLSISDLFRRKRKEVLIFIDREENERSKERSYKSDNQSLKV